MRPIHPLPPRPGPPPAIPADLAKALGAWESSRRATRALTGVSVWMVACIAASMVTIAVFPGVRGTGPTAALVGLLLPGAVILAYAVAASVAGSRLKKAAARIDLATSPVTRIEAGEHIDRLTVLVNGDGVLHVSRRGRRGTLQALKWLSCVAAAAGATASFAGVALLLHAGRPAKALKAGLGGLGAAVLGLAWALARSPFQWIAEPAGDGGHRLILESVSIRGVHAEEFDAEGVEGFEFEDGTLRVRIGGRPHALARVGKDPFAPWRAARIASALAAAIGPGRGWVLHGPGPASLSLPRTAVEQGGPDQIAPPHSGQRGSVSPARS